MKYILLMYSNDENVPSLDTPEAQQAMQKQWQALTTEGYKEGVIVSTNGVAPGSSATTVRVRDGKTMITDGPFAETHEQLGGYFLLDCEDLDEAIKWAAKIPTAAYGSIEIRPLWAPG